MNNKTLSNYFTQGSIGKQLLGFSLPFMASNMLLVLYSTIDMIIVGAFVGTFGLSAVSQSSQIVNFATMVCLGFSNAGQVLIGQALGAGKKQEMSNVIGSLFGYVISLSFFLAFSILILHLWILQVMNIPRESYEMAKQYLLICASGLPFTAGYNMVSAVLRGMGDGKRPLLFIAIASAVNLILDLLFTGLWGWGVVGAAWATILGQAASFLFSVWYLFRHRLQFGFDFKRNRFRFQPKYVSLITSLGTPMAIQSGCINLSMLFVNSLINSIGVVESATFGVGIRIDDIINKISQGIQYAAVPMISQNMGAENRQRAKQVVYWAWAISVSITVVFMILYLGFGEYLFRLFSDDSRVHRMSHVFIHGIICIFPALAIMRGSGAFIQGIGNAKLGMVLAILDGVVLRIGLSRLFGIVFEMGFFGFVLGYALAAYGYAIPSLIYFLSGIWRKLPSLAQKL